MHIRFLYNTDDGGSGHFISAARWDECADCTEPESIAAVMALVDKVIAWKGWPHLTGSALPLDGWTFWFDNAEPTTVDTYAAPRNGALQSDRTDAVAEPRHFSLRFVFQNPGDQLHFMLLAE